MSTRYDVHGRVAVIAMHNPPVNGLGHALRSGIVEGVRRAEADPAVAAIVLIGTDRAFSGGADIREFNTPLASAEPNLNTVIYHIETARKPVIAAISGVAMGGGLAVISAWSGPERRSRCPRSSSASFPAPAARSACRAWSARRRRST